MPGHSQESYFVTTLENPANVLPYTGERGAEEQHKSYVIPTEEGAVGCSPY
ncbi:hypothetical protein TRAPUB_12343 [Trametes pubescens]|uniref:Uncharacterized protein n=1 Tax=Trametes pubescens TaxID=154538 RepID=A0A1M2VU43_TRAPU|nr:hypothetical protein TRAPUB_12343 [Trametes pubescens]